MTSLLSFDCEFTHPSTKAGALMQIGCLIVPWDEKTMSVVQGKQPAGMKIKIDFPVSADATISEWVNENQRELLDRCLALSSDAYPTKRAKLIEFFKSAKKAYGGDIIPAGWCLGSDMAYLFHVLGEECEIVHYAGIDLKGMVIPMFKRVDPGDDDVRKLLGVAENEDEHDALADAEYQMKLLLAAFKRIKDGEKS